MSQSPTAALPSGSRSSMQVLVGTLASRVLNVAALFAVTPVLGPRGFGQLLVVSIIQAIFVSLIDIGFEQYYIYKVKLHGENRTSDEDVASIEHVVFKLRLYGNIVMFCLQMLVSYLLVDVFFSAPVDQYLRIMALAYLFSIPGKINEVRMKKRMLFAKITRARFVGDLFSAAFRVILVYAGFGILGWAGGFVIGVAVNAVMLAILGNYRPSFKAFDPKWRKEVIWFAKHSWFTSLGIFLGQQLGNILVSSFYSLQQAGLIQFSNSYTIDIHSGLAASQLNVLAPFFSNYREDKPRMINAVVQYVKASYFVFGVPLIIAVVFGQDLVPILFSNKWQPAAPVFSMFAFYVLVRIIFSPTLSLLTALGRMRENTIISYISVTIAAVPQLIVGFMQLGIYWYGIVFVIATLIGEGVKSITGMRFAGLHIQDILRPCKNDFICLGLTIIFAGALQWWRMIDSIWHLGVVVIATVLWFYLMQFLLNRQVYALFYSKLRIALGK